MKGLPGSPFYLQATLLTLVGFFFLAIADLFATASETNCIRAANDIVEKTNDQYDILCTGNGFTASIFVITACITLYGAIAGCMQKDIDTIPSFVFFGVLLGYTSDSISNLKLNCSAGDNSENNMFPTDTWDSAGHLCHAYCGSVLGGIFGMVGTAISAYYAVQMKLKGTFYPQRPIGLFIGLSGYALIVCFQSVALTLSSCHDYDYASDYTVPLSIPQCAAGSNGSDCLAVYQSSIDHLADAVLKPLCQNYEPASILLGINSLVPMFGISLIVLYKKRGMWLVICCYVTILSVANTLLFSGQYVSTCQMHDDYTPYDPSTFVPANTDMPQQGLSPYEYDSYQIQCYTFESAYISSLLCALFGGIGVLLSILDIGYKTDHDTFLIRLRRSSIFSYAVCYILSDMFVAVGTMTPNCDLNHEGLDDFLKHDDTVVQNNCTGNSVAFFFYCLAVAAAALGSFVSLCYTFPLDGAALSYKSSLYYDEDETSQNVKCRAIDRMSSINRFLPKEVPVASSLLRFSSYCYQDEEGKGGIKGILNINEDEYSLGKPLIV